MLRQSLWLVLASLCFFAGVKPVSANTSYSYLYKQNEIYEVVVADSQGTSKLEPGIYRVDKRTGASIPLLLGEVLGVNRSYKGVLAYLSRDTVSESSHDILTVINGHVTFLNQNANQKNPKSFSVIGGKGKSAIKVIDVVQGTEVQVPPIHDLEDVRLYAGPTISTSTSLPKGGRLFLLSVKTPTPIGSGLTMAFVVENVSGSNLGVKLAGDAVWVVGHDFLSEESMERLIPTRQKANSVEIRSVSLFAPSMIAKFKNQLSRMSDSPVASGWIDQISRFQKYVVEGLAAGSTGSIDELWYGIPLFEALGKQETLSTSPVEKVFDDSLRTLGQTFDPITGAFKVVDLKSGAHVVVKIGRRELVFMNTNGVDTATISRMKIDRDPKSGEYLIFGEGEKAEDGTERTGRADAYIYFSSGTPILLTKNASANEYQTISLKNLGLLPTDKIDFIRTVMAGEDNRTYQSFVILRKGIRSDKVEIYAVVGMEKDVLQVFSPKKLYEGPVMSLREAKLRTLQFGNEVLFDSVTPIRGPAAYAKGDKSFDPEKNNSDNYVMSLGGVVPKKTVPYNRLFDVVTSGKSQMYLRPILSDVMIKDWLYFHRFDTEGAKISETGFYLQNPKTAPTFLAGYPLFNRKDKLSKGVSHVMQSKLLHSGAVIRMPPVEISIFPYTEKDPAKRIKKSEATKEGDSEAHDVNSFRMGVSLHPEGHSAGQASGFLSYVDVPQPYRSLSYTQIIQGVKGRANEFVILLHFKKDDKIKNSIDGVLVVHGTVSWINDPKERIDVHLAPLTKLHKSFVPPGSASAHLLVDAEGSYYWVDDPSVSKDSPAFRVRKLTNPSEPIAGRTMQVLGLREPDQTKGTDVGFVNGRARFGGRWEIYSEHALRQVVSGLGEHLDKRLKVSGLKDKPKEKDKKSEEEESLRDEKAEAPIFAAFEKYLDSLAVKGRDYSRRPRIILVDPALKEKFKLLFFTRLVDAQTPFSFIGNSRFDYYHANQALDDVEIAEEIQHIIGQRERANLLYVDPSILANREIVTRGLKLKDESDAEKDKEDKKDLYPEYSGYYDYDLDGADSQRPPPFASLEANNKANLLVLLASQGRAKSLRGFKKVTPVRNELPMLTIVTPDEWREIQEVHSPEVSAGVLDDFELNYDFLTSAWTVWPPKSEKAPAEVKDLSKIPYRQEEMKVFPTLERVLTDAASGNLKGKQKIIIVPSELKQLVQKLVMLRWSAAENSTGAWNHTNRKLSLHKIYGTSQTQDEIQDSFRAMRGAASNRQAVLYADLETILRIGRPGAARSETAFRIRDPIRSSRNYLLETEASSSPRSGAEDDGDELASLDDILTELNSTYYQITSMKEELDNIQRRKRIVSDDLTINEQLDARAEQVAKELKAIKSLRSALQDKAKAIDPDYEDQLETHDESDIGSNDDNSDPRPDSGDNSNEEEVAERAIKKVTDKSAYPHLMWWIASEGQAIQPRKKAGWNLGTAVDRQVASVLIGTEEELERLETEMSFESKFFNLKEHFDVVHLEAPSEDTKYQMVQQLFERPEVVGLGIEFKLKNDNGLEPRSQLIYHFINRIDQLAYDQRIEKTSAFIRAYIALKNSLVEDLELRRSRQINEKFIERMFTKVFPMPLNPEILEPQDPLNRLRRQDQAIRDLQAAGYEGSQDLKRRFFETILSQTRPTDTSRPIPNSQILYGTTSTGKTFLVRMLFKMLNLQEYNRTKASNEEADFIFINVARLTDNATNEPDKIPVDEAIKDILDLLAQPKGTRAHIVFDDFHKASTKHVREKLAQFIQGLFEAQNGMFTVRSRDGRRHREIPVQNLNLYMTLNPTANESIRKQYVKDSHRGSELLKREVLAALSGDGFNPEESFLARWSDIVNLDNFPRSAKVPELVKRVRQNASRSGQMVLVDPMVIDHLIDLFPEAHARELLSPATAALTSLPSSAERAPFYIVTMRQQARRSGNAVESHVSQRDLHSAVRDFTQIDPIKGNDPKSLGQVMSFVMRNFRLQVFNFMSLESHMTDTLRLEIPGQANVLKTSFLLGASTHVIDNPRLPDSEILVRPEQLQFLSRTDIEELVRYLLERKEDSNYFPVDLDLQERPNEMDLSNFITGGTVSGRGTTRRDVLIETVAKIEAVLQSSMQAYLRLDRVSDLKEIGHWSDAQVHLWFQNLPEKDPDEIFRHQSQELLNLFFDFQERFHSPSLSDPQKVAFNLYDQVRLFSYALDKAILRLPWGQIANFTIKLATASSDFSLGTRASFREYVGAHQLSPFTIATPEFINEMYNTAISGAGRGVAERVPALKEHFKTACEEFLLSIKAENK